MTQLQQSGFAPKHEGAYTDPADYIVRRDAIHNCYGTSYEADPFLLRSTCPLCSNQSMKDAK